MKRLKDYLNPENGKIYTARLVEGTANNSYHSFGLHNMIYPYVQLCVTYDHYEPVTTYSSLIIEFSTHISVEHKYGDKITYMPLTRLEDIESLNELICIYENYLGVTMPDCVYKLIDCETKLHESIQRGNLNA